MAENDPKKDEEFVIPDSPDEGKSVEVSLDGADAPAVVEPGGKGAPAEKSAADDATEVLRAQLVEERKRTQAAEARAQQEIEHRRRAEHETADSRFSVVTNAIDAATREAEGCERDLIAAKERNDFAAEAKAQRTLARAEAKLLRLEESKATIANQAERAREDRGARPTEGRVDPQPRQEINLDPVEAVAGRLSSRSAAWIRANPDFAKTEGGRLELTGAHNGAVRKGHLVDSDAYFRDIERTLGLDGQAEAAPASPPAARRQAVSAPVSRDVPGHNGTVANPRR